MSNINQIGHYLGNNAEPIDEQLSYRDKGEMLEQYLKLMCEIASDIEQLTGNKNVDIDYLLGIEASYLIGIADGSLIEEDTKPPAVLFETSLFPSLDNMFVDTEVIEEEEDIGECDTNTDDEGYGSEHATNL